jgi:hypothetical protein
MRPPGKESPGNDNGGGQSPPNENEDRCYQNEEPPYKNVQAFLARLNRECPADQGDSHGEMDARKASEQGGHPANYEMEDRQEPEMFFVLVHQHLLLRSGLAAIGSNERSGYPP